MQHGRRRTTSSWNCSESCEAPPFPNEFETSRVTQYHRATCPATPRNKPGWPCTRVSAAPRNRAYCAVYCITAHLGAIVIPQHTTKVKGADPDRLPVGHAPDTYIHLCLQPTTELPEFIAIQWTSRCLDINLRKSRRSYKKGVFGCREI